MTTTTKTMVDAKASEYGFGTTGSVEFADGTSFNPCVVPQDIADEAGVSSTMDGWEELLEMYGELEVVVRETRGDGQSVPEDEVRKSIVDVKLPDEDAADEDDDNDMTQEPHDTIEIEITHYEDGWVDGERGYNEAAYANGVIRTDEKEISFSARGYRKDELPYKWAFADGSRWDWDFEHERSFEICGTSEDPTVACTAAEYFDESERVEDLKEAIADKVNEEHPKMTCEDDL